MKRIAALCIALAAGGALAQSKNATDRYFDSLDLDGDGYVSLAEAAGNAEVVKRFDRGDRNHDGKLSRKEFANLKNVKVRVAKSRREQEEASAATGSSSKSVRKDKTPSASGG